MSWAAVAAPILYFGGAALLLAIARRALRPLRVSPAAALGLAFVPLLFVGPSLLTGRVYAPFNLAYGTEPLRPLAAAYGLDDTERYPRRGILNDVNSQMLPWRAAVRHAWSRGEWPLWNPYMLAGDPLAGSAQSAPYDPIHLWSLLLPLAASWTPAAGLRFLLHAVGMFALLRRFGCRESVAVLGGLGWTFSTFCAFWHAWPLGATLGLLPWLVEAVERLIRRPGLRAALFLAGVLLVAALAGHPESLAHLVASGVAWAGLRIWTRRAGDWARRRRIVALALLAGLGALVASAFFVLPFLDVLEQTAAWRERAGGGHALHRGAPLGAALRSAVAVLAPPVDLAAPVWLSTFPVSGYAGSLLWIPALFALRQGLGRDRWRREVIVPAAALGGFGLLVAAQFPGVREVVGVLPLLARTLTDRFVALVPFALVLLGGLGVEAWLRSPATLAERWRKTHWTVLAAAAVLATIVLLVLPETQPARARAWTALGWLVLPVALAALALWRLGRRPRWALAVFALLFVAQRAGEMAGFYPSLPAAAFFPRPAVLAALPDGAADEGPYRLVGAHWALLPNTSAHWRLEDPRGYQPTRHRRFAEIEAAWSKPQVAWFGRVDDLRSPWLRLLNVRYAITGWPPPPRGWREIARSDPKGTRLLRSIDALPRAFLPRHLRVERRETLALLRSASPEELDFRARAWIQAPGFEPAKPEVRNAQGVVRVEARGSGYRLTTRLNRPGWVVVSSTAWRGWRATDLTAASTSGAVLPLGFANHAFLAVPVEAGRREIELRYVPAAFAAGLLLSAATALAGAVLLPGTAFWKPTARRRLS
jgi:hypothetical protein